MFAEYTTARAYSISCYLSPGVLAAWAERSTQMFAAAYARLLSPPVSLPKLVSCAASPSATNVKRLSRYSRDISHRTVTAVSLEAHNLAIIVTVPSCRSGHAKGMYIGPNKSFEWTSGFVWGDSSAAVPVWVDLGINFVLLQTFKAFFHCLPTLYGYTAVFCSVTTFICYFNDRYEYHCPLCIDSLYINFIEMRAALSIRGQTICNSILNNYLTGSIRNVCTDQYQGSAQPSTCKRNVFPQISEHLPDYTASRQGKLKI